MFGEPLRCLVNTNTTVAQVGLDLGAAKLEEYFNKFRLENLPLACPCPPARWARQPAAA